MSKKRSFLAIIPARGGSKRLPRKNVLPLLGKPLISWTIEAALQSEHLDEIIVTSDDDEILSIAKNYRVTALKRPLSLATDTSGTYEVVEHAIANANGSYDFIVLLQPTSPLRNNKHIDEAIELLVKKNADAVISVCEMEHSPLWANTLPADGSMENFLNKHIVGKRSQDLDTFYRLNGAIYICRTQKLLESRGFFLEKNIYAYVMDRAYSIDIDENIDFTLATILLTNN